MQSTTANAPKKNISPPPAGRYSKSTKQTPQRLHLSNEGKSGLKAERVRALWSLHSLRSTKKLEVEKRGETHFLGNEQNAKWIEHYVERETARARKRIEDAEATVQQEQEDMKHAVIKGLTNKELEKTFEKMMVAIGDSLSDLASSDNGEDGEEEDEETEQGKLSEDDKPGWAMGTITKTIQQRMERFRQMQMKLDELTQPGWEDAANYFGERDEKYGTSELMIPAIVQPQTDDEAAAPASTTFWELMEGLEIVPRISHMPQGTSQPGSSHMRLGSMKPQWDASISGLLPAAEPNMSPLLKAKPDEPVSFYPCI